MIYPASAFCKFCIHYTDNQTCKAFPKGIPDAVFSGEIIHDHPIEGDQGIRHHAKLIHWPDMDDFLSGKF